MLQPLPQQRPAIAAIRSPDSPVAHARHPRPLRALLLAASLPLVVACSPEPSSPHDHPDGDLTPAQAANVARVRTTLDHFQDPGASRAAGYTEQFPEGCAVSPEGAQGFHYLNPALVDTVVELLRPELVMYEPQPDGSSRLVGVDYVVPLDAWTGAEPPTLLGVPFMRNEPLGVWALHIWAWRANPEGMFAAWNPDVSCAHAR